MALCGRGIAVAAAVSVGGCFNPGGSSDGGTTQATTGSSSVATSVGPSTDPPALTTTSAPTSSDETCGTACGTDPDTGVGPGTVHETGTSTGTGPNPGTSSDSGSEGTGSTGSTGSTESTDTTDPLVNPPVTFMAQTKTFSGANALATIDLDGDPTLEVVVTSIKNSNLGVVFDGAGIVKAFMKGSAKAVIAVDLAGGMFEEVALGITANPGQIWSYYGGMNDTIVDGPKSNLPGVCITPISMATGLLDNDAQPDLVVACEEGGTNLFVFQGNADAFMPSMTLALSVSPVSVGLFDVRGDKPLDLVVVSGAGVSVYEGDKTLFFPSDPDQTVPAPAARGVAAGEFHGDGYIDLAVVQPSGLAVLTFKGSGADLADGEQYDCESSPQDIQVVDLNADMLDDLVIVESDRVSVGFNAGGGAFDPPVQLGLVTAGWRVAVGDYSGDGKPDIAATSNDTVTLYVQQP